MLATTRLARWSSRRPKLTIGLWLVAVAAAFLVIATSLGGALTPRFSVDPGTQSMRANSLLVRSGLLPRDATNEVIVIRSPSLTAGSPEFEHLVARIAQQTKATGVVAAVRGAVLISRDGHAEALGVVMKRENEGDIAKVIGLVKQADRDPRFEVSITGTSTVDRDFDKLAQHDLKTGELFFGLPAALVVLLLVFGTVVAGLVPVVTALMSIVIGLAVLAGIGQAYELSVFAVNMLSGMGLALGIDYSLFVISRYREERGRSRPELAAIEASAATAGRAVFFSGMAFAVALLGMLIVPDRILRSLAIGGAVVALVSVAAALTLLPAVLSLVGDGVNALRLPYLGRSAIAGTGLEGRFWGAAARAVTRRAVPALVAAVALLLAVAWPVVELRTGHAGYASLPSQATAKRGFLALKRDFEAGYTAPVRVAVEGDASSAPLQGAVRTLEARMRSEGAFGAPSLRVSPGGEVTLLSAPLRADPTGPASERAVRELRRVAPQAFRGVDARVLVGGQTAEAIDYTDLMEHWLPFVFVFVLGLSFALLTVVFHSIVLPVKAILLNLLSVGAAYGLIVLVFQKGVAAGLLGFQRVDAVEPWVPLFLFSVLFGLSMDYHVFLLSRIRERFLQTGDNTEAVASGIASTGRLITGAALIIIMVFIGFARGDLVMFQQMGFGVAVALFLDATIVRSVLVPASMKLLGRWNWYLPRRLGWLPRLEVE